MTFSALLISAALASGAAAAGCSVAATSTITNAVQASSLGAACQTFTGTLAIATDATEALDISGIQRFKNGGLYAANNNNLPSLTGNTLTTIDNAFTLSNVTGLNGIVFPMLTSVGSLSWQALANLYEVTLTAGISTANAVEIIDTQLSNLDGFSFDTINTLTISNNRQLSDVNLDLKSITGEVIISNSASGDMPTVEFDSLQYAVNISMYGVSSFSAPDLKVVNNTLGIYASSLSTLDLPSLTTTGQFYVDNCPNLGNLSVPKLDLVTGAVNLVDDTGLNGTIAFPKLTQVRGAVIIDGSFTSVSMPSITVVNGVLNLTSSHNIDNTCKHFSADSNAHLASVVCTQVAVASGTSTPTPHSTSSGSGSAASTSTGAASSSVAVPMVGGLLGLFLAILGML